MKPILVTGATGQVGREVVDALLHMGVPVRALTRDPSKANKRDGVEFVAGDLTDPQSLDVALQDTSNVFLLWTAAGDSAPAVMERLARHDGRVVLLSSPHQTAHPFFQQPNPMARHHANLEQLMADAGVTSTIIRPGMFASNTKNWWGSQIRSGDVVRWPYGDTETAPIDPRDIGAVAAQSLTNDAHARKDYVITGPESITQAAQTRIIGEVLGRTIRFEELSPDEFRAQFAAFNAVGAANMLLAAWSAARGLPAYVTSTVFDVTGLPARSFREWVTDHADNFR